MPGTNGTNGINGLDAFTILTSLFTNPGVGNPTTVGVLNSSWMVVGEVVIVGQGVGAALANPGPVTCEVTAIPSSASVTLTPLGYPGDSVGNVSIGGVITPVGRAHSQAKVTYIFNGTVVFTPQVDTTLLLVECIGAGGSGGGCDGGANASAASGGGGGGYSAVWLTSVAASYACAVGAGGAAPAAGANNGNAGGDTTFDSPSVCTAKGGSAGTAGAAAGTADSIIAGGQGGAAASGVGDVKIDGGAGRSGIRLSGTVGMGGGGGAAAGGGGGESRDVISGQAGSAASNYGGGGGGALSIGASAAAAGAGGANGLIRVTEFS